MNSQIGLPLDFYPDGLPIFLRGDFIRSPRPLGPDHGVIYENLVLPEHLHLHPKLNFNLAVIPPTTDVEINSKELLDNPKYVETLNKSRETEIAPSIYFGKSVPDQKHGRIYGKIIQALDSNCRVILQRWKSPGKIDDFVILTLQSMQFAIIPASYEFSLVNASTELSARFVMLVAREENSDLETIRELNGSGYLLKKDGSIISNIHYSELPIPRIHQGHIEFKLLQRRPLYEMLTAFPKRFDFLVPTQDLFFSGAV